MIRLQNHKNNNKAFVKKKTEMNQHSEYNIKLLLVNCSYGNIDDQAIYLNPLIPERSESNHWFEHSKIHSTSDHNKLQKLGMRSRKAVTNKNATLDPDYTGQIEDPLGSRICSEQQEP